ncbi:DUF58 domain-containing protein [Bacillus sp. DJP31]|uniref:DUF58 domain-containing protein n=1 Tax=Bacillus sp. DJP31 TaxID=3409789 RepID=UPI003BB6A068
MTILLKNLWGRFQFQDKGVVPTKRLLLIYLAFSLLAIVSSAWNISWTLIIGLNVTLLFLSLLDLFVSPKKNQLSFKRTIPHEMERGIKYNVQLEVGNSSSQSIEYRLIDGLHQSFKRPFPLHGHAPKETTSVITYETLAPVRGNYEIYKLFFRYRSHFGLWEKQVTVFLEDTVKVIPDLTETKHYLESAQRYLMYEGLTIRKQKSGVGEFSKVRTYVEGDDPRKINWRQTAKLQTVMTNDYEPEHGKYLTVLLDCGRMMGAELVKGNRLERAIEAAITVTAAALQKGEYVSVLAFSNKIKVYVPPAKGMAHLQTILHSIYDLEVDANESNYSAVLQYIQTVQKKRSLLLLFSDVRTFLHEESALAYLKRLRQRHLFLMIGVEDHTLISRINEAPIDVQKVMVKTIAQQQMLFKKREKSKWEKQGLQMVEAREEKLATAAVSYYIDIMNRGLL